jgi:hypothetical protein
MITSKPMQRPDASTVLRKMFSYSPERSDDLLNSACVSMGEWIGETIQARAVEAEHTTLPAFYLRLKLS